MRKSGPIMYVRDDDNFIDQYFDPKGARYQPPGDRFEIDHLELALKYVKNFRTAIDGGAYYGSWARYMAKQFDKVNAYEPTLSLYHCLCKNVAVGFWPTIATHCIALGSHIGNIVMGQGKLYHHPGMETIIHTGTNLPSNSPWAHITTVDCMGYDDLDFLKLDIEGYEYFALQGAMETLTRCHPVVMFEENVRGKLEHDVEPGSCGKLLTDLGATLVDRIGSDHIYAWRD